MLSRLVFASLRYRAAVIVIAGAFLAIGVHDATRTPLDVFPEFAPPRIEVQTEAPGMSSEAVEQAVTVPIESALNGLPHMTDLRSKSVQGLSAVELRFERGTDIFRARQMVAERVAEAATKLPRQTHPPLVMPPLSTTSRVLHIGLTPKKPEKLKPGEPKLDQTEVSALMKWVVEPRLLAIPGVANVSTYGLQPKHYQVFVKPGDLRARGVTLDQVALAAKDAVVFGSAGFHDTPNQRLAVQYKTRVKEVSDLGEAVVAFRDGQPILLKQVAEVTTGAPAPIGEGVINDEPGLMVVIEKFPWGNTLEVTEAIEAVLENLKTSLPGVEITTGIFRPASFIELALGNLRYAMILGCILVTLILIAFLFEWRTAFISLTAIPLSIVTALFVLNRMGVSFNTMVLAGLAIAIGEVVDDAIIDVENIVRRLRQNFALSKPLSAFRVVFAASLEVRSAVVYATFIVGFVCLPIFFMSGVAGSFFRPLALAYVLSVMASLLVALTVTPALSLLLLPQAVRTHREAPLTLLLRGLYPRLLLPCLRRPALTLGALVLLLAGSVFAYFQLRDEYLPPFQERDFLMHWVAKPGTGIDVMRQDIVKVGKEMLAETAVTGFSSHIARAEAGEEVYGPNFSELWVSLGDFHGDYAAAKKKIDEVMARHPGFQHDLLTYLQERIKEVLSGAGASIVLRIYGPELDVLRDKAQEVRRAIEGEDGKGRVKGVTDLRVEAQVLVPQLELVLKPDMLAAYGLSAGQVLDNLTTLLNGKKVGEVHGEQKVFDLVVWGHPSVRANLTELRELEIELPGAPGATVPLSVIGELRQVNAPNTVRHDKASRCIDVTCNFDGRDLSGVVEQIRERIAAIPSQGYRIEILGEYQARLENQRQLLWLGLLSVVGIALLLYLDFRSFRLTLLVLLTLPFALVGGVFAAYLSSGVLSLGSLIGFITVLGIAARNGIMVVSHYRHLQREEGVPFGRELILRGATERVVPILMTALAAGLGLAPLALSGSKPGYEVEFPMAIVILGGLFTSTLLNLFVLPVLFERFGQAPETALEEEDYATLMASLAAPPHKEGGGGA